jgi:hypothetical protein
VADALQVPEADLLAKVFVDVGEGKKMPLAAIIEGYKQAPEATRLTAELGTKRTELEQERTSLQAEAEAAMQRAWQFTRSAAALVASEEPDWKRLEQEDQSQYLIQRQHHQDRVQRFRDIQATFAQEAERAQHAAKTSREKFQREEVEALSRVFPDLAKPEFKTGFFESIQATMRSVGFRDEEVNPQRLPLLDDHRTWRLLHLAAQQFKTQQEAPLLLKKVRNLPSLTVPSAARRDELSTQARAQKAQAGLMERLRKTGDIADAAAILNGRI